MAIYLGIDGGGSKTSCVIGDETAMLGRGSAGASHAIRTEKAKAEEAMWSAVQQACAEANVRPQEIVRTVAGFAGASRPQIKESVRKFLASRISGEIIVAGDTEVALSAAFGDGPGVVVIAGTGSMGYGRNAQGERAESGGWGFAIGDEGSGYWIGRTALVCAFRAHDEGEATTLHATIAQAWGLDNPDQLKVRANSLPTPEFSALLPLVLAASEAGDTVARRVLMQAGLELARLARLIVQKVFADAPVVPVAMTGGVFRHSPLVREVFYNTLGKECQQVDIRADVVEPVQGALELARRGVLQRG